MVDGETLPPGLARQVGMLGERREQRRLGRRHLGPFQGQTVEEAHHALRHGAQIVQRLGLVGDLAEVAAARVVLGLEVALQHQPAVAHDHHAVQVPGALVGDELVEPRLEVRGEAGIGGGDGGEVGGGRGERAGRLCHEDGSCT